MMRKRTVFLVGLVFICSMIFLTASCAKKHVATETAPAEPTTEFDADKKSKELEEQARRDYEAKLAELKKKKEEEARRRQALLAQLDSQVRAFESEHIHFDFDRSEIKPEAREIMKKKAAWLKEHPEFSIRIEGHCDERGTAEYNLALGERRANAAWKYLNALGISGERMDTVSYGEERPFDPRSNEEAWAKNRRAEFKIIR